jgi:VWFA-related protein
MTRATLPFLGICLVFAGQEQPTFRAGTTLVEFTFVATDGKGNPVTDLAKEEILVTENGRPRELAFFRFEGRYTPVRSQPLPSGEFTNRGEFTPGAARNVTAIVLDAINVSEEGQASVREDLMRYLDSLPSGTRAALYGMGSQLTVLDDFTEDVKSVRAHVAASKLEIPRTFAAPGIIAGGFGVTPGSGSAEMAAAKDEAMAAEARALAYYNQGVQDDRIARTLAGLEAIGDHLAGIPGRKNLVWVSSGLPLITMTAGWPKSYDASIRRTAQRLASQGVAIYSVVGLARYRAGARGGNAVDIFASVTGGRVALVMNDPTLGIRLAGSDSRSAYSVGFYSDGEPDDRWHSLNLKSKRPGVKVLYRQGYLAERATPEAQEWTTGQWTATIHGALGSSALRIDARAIVEGETIRMQLQIPVEDLSLHQAGSRLSADREIAVAEKARSGETGTQKLTVTIRAGEDKASSLKERLFRHQLSWKLKPGTDTIRIVVRDRHTGRYGTVDLPVKQIPTH